MLGAAHAIGHHHDEGEALVAGDVVVALVEAAELDVDALVERGNEEVVLVGLPDQALVGEAVDIDLGVEGLARNALSRGRGFVVDAGHGPSSLCILPRFRPEGEGEGVGNGKREDGGKGGEGVAGVGTFRVI